MKNEWWNGENVYRNKSFHYIFPIVICNVINMIYAHMHTTYLCRNPFYVLLANEKAHDFFLLILLFIIASFIASMMLTVIISIIIISFWFFFFFVFLFDDMENKLLTISDV